ncbi:class I SAM-dependent methyltransferase [Streptomyces ipomoeae]|uniref:Methyltransferase domain protein n=1 Tax=Streptomyces ipomoeae 91-03 TaxID=698759 RepID=L1KTZ0_9ACTN|nr:class I SAM-dependent methyltransferase [Streptomyces ipomoeae]EKX63925.1 methyltransferase domain protein [Streptomyces ipomoeae 91-03]TQE34953.1 class I SAM-dependent methyltransferase [Streptomyces ipomoeae]
MPTVEERLWDTWVEAALDKRPEELGKFRWTQYGDHGPGHELFAAARRVLELGFGTGRHLSYLLGEGFDAYGVDLSPAGVKLVHDRYPQARGRFTCADVRAFLRETQETFEALYSVFGSVWFTDPHELLPLVRDRLEPGGIFVFSQPPAIPGCYGAQGMFKGGFAGEPMFLRRYDYTPETWADMLQDAGFAIAQVEEIAPPVPGHIGTLLVRATRP